MELKEVFEPVLNFIRNLQKKDKEPASKQAAKDRLKLVLMQDRASVSPDFFDIMKREIIDVIKKYIEIDEDALEVELTRGLEAGLEGPALHANIPIKNVKPMAPKADEDDGEDHLDEIDEEEELAELEIAINEATEGGVPLTEEQAEAVADAILSHIEEKAVEAEEAKKEVVEEAEKVEDEQAEKKVETKKKTATRKTTTKKTTSTTKKKTTSKKAK